MLPGSYTRDGRVLALDVSVFSKTFIDAIRSNDLSVYTPPTPIPTPNPPPTPQPATVDYKVLFPRVNVRANPSSDSAWVRFAVKDEILHVVKVENGWAQLLDGTYIFAGYTQILPGSVPTPPAPEPPSGAADYSVLYSRINVRSNPSSDSAWVRFAVKDEVLHVVSIDNGWAKLSDATYVFADYIRKV
jgi:hypothetical protein